MESCFLGSCHKRPETSFKLSNRNIFLFPVVSLLVFAQFSYPLNIWSFVCLLPFMPAVSLGPGRCVVWEDAG